MKTLSTITVLVLLVIASQTYAQSGLAYNHASDKPLPAETTVSPAFSAPAFDGGQVAMAVYTENNLVYPEKARKKRLEGTVIVTFYVNEDGSLSNVHVSRSVCKELDKSAVTFVKKMPNWIPAMQNYEPQRVKYSIPVTYQLTF